MLWALLFQFRDQRTSSDGHHPHWIILRNDGHLDIYFDNSLHYQFSDNGNLSFVKSCNLSSYEPRRLQLLAQCRVRWRFTLDNTGLKVDLLKAHLIFIFLPGFGPMYVMCSTQSVHLSETSWMQWLHTLPLTCSDSKHELCCDTSCKQRIISSKKWNVLMVLNCMYWWLQSRRCSARASRQCRHRILGSKRGGHQFICSLTFSVLFTSKDLNWFEIKLVVPSKDVRSGILTQLTSEF